MDKFAQSYTPICKKKKTKDSNDTDSHWVLVEYKYNDTPQLWAANQSIVGYQGGIIEKTDEFRYTGACLSNEESGSPFLLGSEKATWYERIHRSTVAADSVLRLWKEGSMRSLLVVLNVLYWVLAAGQGSRIDCIHIRRKCQNVVHAGSFGIASDRWFQLHIHIPVLLEKRAAAEVRCSSSEKTMWSSSKASLILSFYSA